MRSTFKITLILTLLLISATINGCGTVVDQTSGKTSTAIAATQSTTTTLSYNFDIKSTTDNVYSIGFKITNTGSEPTEFTFLSMPASYYFEIYDEKGSLVGSEQTGILCSLQKVELAPGATYSIQAFNYKKATDSSYMIKNTISFYTNQKKVTKEVSTTF